MKISYDQASDSMYIELRPLPSVRTREIEYNVMADYGEDGELVGYDVQNVRLRPEAAIRLITAHGNLMKAEITRYQYDEGQPEPAPPLHPASTS